MMGEASEPLLKLELERASEFLSLEPLPGHLIILALCATFAKMKFRFIWKVECEEQDQ